MLTLQKLESEGHQIHYGKNENAMMSEDSNYIHSI